MARKKIEFPSHPPLTPVPEERAQRFTVSQLQMMEAAPALIKILEEAIVPYRGTKPDHLPSWVARARAAIELAKGAPDA